MSDAGYANYAGRCKQLAEDACVDDPTLTLVRGHYICPYWGERAHWWCRRPDGTIVDPTVTQFPTEGAGAEYREFDGKVSCAECHKALAESEASFESNYAFCSTACHMRFVGLGEYVQER